MAGASIIHITYDDKEVKARLKRLAQVAGDISPALTEIGEHLIRSHRQRFADGVDPEGKQWEPLAESTLARKKKNADKVLIEHGDLMGSLHYNNSGNELEFGTNLIYGATHQFGSEDGAIPARPFLGISSDDEAEILHIIDDHIAAALQ